MAIARLASIVLLSLAAYQATAGVTRQVKCPSGHFTTNEKCCQLFPVVDLLQHELFHGSKCEKGAHHALRLSFHDAIGFSLNGGKGGGADGSILIFHDVEEKYHANGGVAEIVRQQMPVFKKTNLTGGDLYDPSTKISSTFVKLPRSSVHLAAAVGTSNCPGSPRLEFWLGRPAPAAAAPDKTIPEPTDSVTDILNRFAEAGLSPREAVALLASHTMADQDRVDPTVEGTPFDSTVERFDSQFFLEVLLNGTMYPGHGSHEGEALSAIKGEMRLKSDFLMSQDPRTACFWQAMINNQKYMMAEFKAAMARMQVLGQDVSTLTDCSDVVPVPRVFNGPIKYPPSFSEKDIVIACAETPFPSLSTQPGPPPTVSPV
ncbi:hypothetical protein NLJ89_g4993 [Agrocybe chaxingu]|uniref:Peroxidase n=1 Tax=Agrocybe chaxingu TaxID=84603 RepID=A0A9W8MW07_9AGAR|nr:hypothetical protein NLJ89_g4993 [Agrocybe chaxingu]